jgi:putative SOS response-associated peptidase YedK
MHLTLSRNNYLCYQFAGLWDTWQHPTEEDPENVTYTFTIMTTNPCKQLMWLHDRMPVIFRSRGG